MKERDACVPLTSPPLTHPCVCMCVTEGQTADLRVPGCTQVCRRGTHSSVCYPKKPDEHNRGKDGRGVPRSCTSIVRALKRLSPHLTHVPVSIAPNQPTPQRHNPCQPGRLLRLFLEPKSLTLENTFNLFLSQLPLLLLGLLTHLQALDFSRSLACLFWRIRELAMAAAMAATAPAARGAQARGGRRPAAASMLLGRPQGRGRCRAARPRHPAPLGTAARDARRGEHQSPARQQQSSSRFRPLGSSSFDFLPLFYSSQLLAGESLQAEVSVSTEITQITCKTSLQASPDALSACSHGTSTWCKIIASLLAPISAVNFSSHPSPPHSNPSKHLLDSSRGCPVAGVFWILFPLLA